VALTTSSGSLFQNATTRWLKNADRMVAYICHLIFFCHNALFFQKNIVLWQVCHNTLLFESQHIIFSKDIVCVFCAPCGPCRQHNIFLKLETVSIAEPLQNRQHTQNP